MQNLNTFYRGFVEGVVSAFVSCVFLSNLVVRVVVSAEKKTRLIKLTFCVLIVSKKSCNFSAGDNLLSVSQESKSVY